MQYSIHEDNMQKLTEKLAKIERKCNKYNCSFKFAEVGEEYKEIQHYKEVEGAYGVRDKARTHVTIERFVIVEVEGIAKINNWQFVATLQHTENGNIIRSFAEIEIPEKYRTVKPVCEHCNSDRARKDTYLILNTETGEFKQVGKNCLQDYTNGLSAEMVANYLSYFDTIAKLNNGESLGGYTRHYINVQEYLLSCAETIKKCGFISAKTARDAAERGEFLIKTSERAYKLKYDISRQWQEEREKIQYNPDTEENNKTVKAALNWILQSETKNDYMHNLKISCMDEYTEYRNLGLLASLIPAYTKATATAEEKQKTVSKSQFVGSVGDKLEFKGSIKFITSFETQFGYTHVYRIIDAEGNIFTWFTANNPIGDDNEKENVTIKGTIKEHKEYNGEKQTVLTRCKVK